LHVTERNSGTSSIKAGILKRGEIRGEIERRRWRLFEEVMHIFLKCSERKIRKRDSCCSK
jgi:hypothetical protein